VRSFSDMKQFAKIFLILISICWLGFIFSNSLKPADSSTEQSDKIVDVTETIIDTVVPNNSIHRSDLAVFVRKTAHFTEFCILSVLVTLTCITFTERKRAYPTVSLILCAPACITDELLQLTSSGRACSVLDMLLDYLGVVTGFIIVLFLFLLIRKKKRTKL